MSLSFILRPNVCFSLLAVGWACEVDPARRGRRGSLSGTVRRNSGCVHVLASVWIQRKRSRTSCGVGSARARGGGKRAYVVRVHPDAPGRCHLCIDVKCVLRAVKHEEHVSRQVPPLQSPCVNSLGVDLANPSLWQRARLVLHTPACLVIPFIGRNVRLVVGIWVRDLETGVVNVPCVCGSSGGGGPGDVRRWGFGGRCACGGVGVVALVRHLFVSS